MEVVAHYIYSTYYKALREVLFVSHKVCKNSDRIVKLQQLCVFQQIMWVQNLF